MTREQMRLKKEYTTLIQKQLFKPTTKQFGFKVVSGYAYRQEGDWLYTAYVSNNHDTLFVKVSIKPVLLDDLFWEIFEMRSEVFKKPFSFHITAAFVPYSCRLKELEIPLSGLEQVTQTFDQAFTECQAAIAEGMESIRSIADYRELLLQKPRIDMLNVVLCDIAEGRYAEAMKAAENELAEDHSGGFVKMEGGDIYHFIVRYCRERLNAE